MSICCSLVVSQQSQEDQVYWSSVGSLSPCYARVELCFLSWQIHEQMAVERFARVVVISFQPMTGTTRTSLPSPVFSHLCRLSQESE